MVKKQTFLTFRIFFPKGNALIKLAKYNRRKKATSYPTNQKVKVSLSGL